MVTIVKHEWHQHDRQYAIEIDENILAEIYPDLDDVEIAAKLQGLEEGDITVDEIVEDAYDNDVELEWDFQYDDCWTDRKGGYEVTYEMGDESSWHSEPEPNPPSIKCTKCRWDGSSWETRTSYVNEQSEVLPDDCEDFHDTKDVCPMCDGDVELTEFGIKEKEELAKRMAELDALLEADEEEVPCYSCGELHKESELPELNGQYHCPDCHEGWVMLDSREEDDGSN